MQGALRRARGPVGAAGGARDPLRPLAFLSASSAGTLPAGAHAPVDARRVTSMAGLDAALASARAEGRPALVSFTASWCTVCKSNARTLEDPQVAPALSRTAFIAADVTDYDADSRALMERFGIIGPPTMFVIDPAGREVPGSRTIGAINVPDLVRTLDAARM